MINVIVIFYNLFAYIQKVWQRRKTWGECFLIVPMDGPTYQSNNSQCNHHEFSLDSLIYCICSIGYYGVFVH